MTSSPSESQEASRAAPRLAFLAKTSLTFLKPLLRKALRTVAARLYEAGVTANQVTLTSLVGSVLVGAFLGRFAAHSALFAMLPTWLVARTAFAAIDGALAVEFGQKSRLGGILNETGDVVSDIALFLPLAFVAPFSGPSIAWVVCCAAMSEFVGMAGAMLSSTRRFEGPLGKADRSIVLALVAIGIAACGRLPAGAWIVVPALCVGAGHHHLKSIALRDRRAGLPCRIIPSGLTTKIGVPGRSLAVIRIWSR